MMANARVVWLLCAALHSVCLAWIPSSSRHRHSSRQCPPTTTSSSSLRRHSVLTLPATAFWNFDFESIFGPSPADAQQQQERARLKQELLATCRQPQVTRSAVEKAMAALTPLTPVRATATSSLLQKEWILIWTTEKEINFFLDGGWATEVSQTIHGSQLENMIPFTRGGSLGVAGTLAVADAAGMRTAFQFDSATLDLGRWGKYTLPPVGAGWFDTLYLDGELRVDINSRDDILICAPRS